MHLVLYIRKGTVGRFAHILMISASIVFFVIIKKLYNYLRPIHLSTITVVMYLNSEQDLIPYFKKRRPDVEYSEQK